MFAFGNSPSVNSITGSLSNPRGGGLLAPVENTSTSERLACASPPSNKITRKKLHKVQLIIIILKHFLSWNVQSWIQESKLQLIIIIFSHCCSAVICFLNNQPLRDCRE